MNAVTKDRKTLIGSVSFSGWEAPARSLHWNEWANEGKTLRKIHSGVKWAIGDWLNYGEREYGERYAQAADDTGMNREYLRSAKWLSGRFPKETRVPGATWTHHRLVASLPDDAAQRLLTVAAVEEWSSEQLREKVDEVKAAVGDNSRTPRAETQNDAEPSRAPRQAPHIAPPPQREAPRQNASAETESEDAEESGTEWFVSDDILDRVKKVFGGRIDTDPASNPVAQRRIKAKRYFTTDDDGLTKDWTGNVWLHPDFEDESLNAFVDKLMEENPKGRVKDTIALLPDDTSAPWFKKAMNECNYICIPYDPIDFISEDGEIVPASSGCVIFYFGIDNRPGFKEAFGDLGKIFQRDN